MNLLQMLGSLAVLATSWVESSTQCGGRGLKYLWGDALVDSQDCLGPNNVQYPSALIARNFRKNSFWGSSSRNGRANTVLDPSATQSALLRAHAASQGLTSLPHHRAGRDFSTGDSCPPAGPSRLCKTRYNTTAPMYGVSLTSGQPVTIVQKFPDLLQQVVYEVCESKECEVVRGECTQTYVPYLFLVIPLGPVTLTGQDYVLVESGCVCKPRIASSASQSHPADQLPLH